MKMAETITLKFIVIFLSNLIFALVSLLTCSALLFLICAKKLHKSTSALHIRADGGDIEPSLYPRRSSTYKDILSNPKKTDLIRQGKLHVDKKNPDYDTLVDIDKELSLDKMDESQKSFYKSDEKQFYEALLPSPDLHKSSTPKKEISVLKIQQTPSKPAIQCPRRVSNIKLPASNLPSKMHTASKAKVILVDPTQRISMIPLQKVQSLEATRLPQPKRENKMDLVGLEQRRRSSTLVKVASKTLGAKLAQPSATNMWDAAKIASKQSKGKKIVYSQYVHG